jgi:outer membrane protein TolC
MKPLKFILILMVALGFFQVIHAQEQASDSLQQQAQALEVSGDSSMTEEDSVMQIFDPKKIAPLEELTSRAYEYAASLKFQTAMISEQISRYKVEKRKWMKLLSIQGTVTYGTGSGLSATDDGTVITTQLVDQVSLYYNVGAIIKLDPEYWGNRKNNIEIMSAQIEKARYNEEAIKQGIRQAVMTAYFTLKQNLTIVEINAEAVESSLINYETGKIFFERGDMSLNDFNSLLQAKVGAEIKYQKAIGDYIMAYNVLKDICGGKID